MEGVTRWRLGFAMGYPLACYLLGFDFSSKTASASGGDVLDLAGAGVSS